MRIRVTSRSVFGSFTPYSILKKRGLNKGGEAQKFLDQRIMEEVEAYMPYKSGALTQSMWSNTKIGSGRIRVSTPYARYQYYGRLMVDPMTGKGAFHFVNKQGEDVFYSRKGVKKLLTSRPLTYDQSVHPHAGNRWFGRMWFAKHNKIGRELAEFVGGKYKG